MDLLDRMPPQDLQAESAVLGCVMLDPDALHRIAGSLLSGHFYVAKNRVIYEAMLALSADGTPADALTLKAALLRTGVYEKVGADATMRDLIEVVPSAANVIYYAKRVKEKAELRALIQAASKVMAHAYENTDAPLAETMDFAEKTMTEAIGNRSNSRSRTMHELVIAEAGRVDRGERVAAVFSGFAGLDRITNGFKAGGLTILAARASMGKSSLSLSCAKNIAAHARVPVGIFSLEMEGDEIAQNLIGQVASLSSFRLRANEMKPDERNRFDQYAGEVAKLPIFVDDSPGLTLMALRSRARTWKMQYGIGLMIVDYLQLMEGERSKNSNREQEVSSVSRGLKVLAKELRLPVIAIAQLNRDVEKRSDKKPMLSDLRESGSIEQDADLVLLLYREAYYKPERPDLANVATVIVAKNRHGPTGRCDIGFEGQYMRFS